MRCKKPIRSKISSKKLIKNIIAVIICAGFTALIGVAEEDVCSIYLKPSPQDSLPVDQVTIAAPKGEPKQWFVDKYFVYEHGTLLSKKYLKQKAPEVSKKLETVLPWIVRIEVQHGIVEDSYSSNHGTGIILSNGKVITAKHVLYENVKDLTAETRVILTTVDGRVFRAKVSKQGDRDWLSLEMQLDEKQKPMLESPIKMGSPIKNEIAVVLGYPAQLGLNVKGKVKPFSKGNKNKNIPVSKLKPMLVVSSVSDVNTMALKPLAGFPPVGGMSGGPVLNSKGEVIAVQSSVSITASNGTG